MVNPLHLSGYGVKIKVENMRSRSELVVADGRDGFRQTPMSYHYGPRKIPYDSVIIDGHSGYISLQALHWLSRNNVPAFVLNFDGKLITSILPPSPVKADIRTAQIRAMDDREICFTVARELVRAKLQRSLDVLGWLDQSYDIRKEKGDAEHEALGLAKARNVTEIRVVEGRVAQRYWEAFQSVIPETFLFRARITRSHQNNATDPVNLALNYAYGVLEGEVRWAINSVGLEPSAGFLHDFAGYQTKESLVYDLQEPFRWLCDVTVLEAVESRTLDLKDFYFIGDDYRYRIEVNAKRRFLGLLQKSFNSGVRYGKGNYMWDTVIFRKAQELGRFLLGKSPTLNFSEPKPDLPQEDTTLLRRRILDLSQNEAGSLGISKSTLHYLRNRARDDRPMKVYGKVSDRLKLEKA